MRWFFAALLFLGAATVSASGPARAAGPHEILITSTAFTPSPLTITLGEAVYWCNADTAAHSVVFEGGPDSGTLQADDCTENLTLTAAGTYSYHDGHSSLTGSIVVDAAPTTTTAAPTTTVASPATTAPPTATTRAVTSTTRRRVTTTAAFKKSATRQLTTTTLAEWVTTTSFLDTTTTEFTTTTVGSFAITETGAGDDSGRTLAVVLVGMAVLGGAGYLGYRYRYRFMR